MSDSQNANVSETSKGRDPARGGDLSKKIIVLAAVIVAVAIGYTAFGDALKLENLAAREAELKKYQAEQPALVYGAAFVIYVLVTGLSLPGAAVMSLVIGWYFKLLRGTILVSFASTTGATMAFLLSRYLFRDAIQRKFGERLAVFNEALDREGAFYLFTLRLIPAVPFFVINVVMGLTRISTRTFWWVSQLGMLAGTLVYVYAGSQVPDLQTLAEHGAKAVFSPRQLAQITIAFVLLGVFPIAVKKLVERVRPASTLDPQLTES